MVRHASLRGEEYFRLVPLARTPQACDNDRTDSPSRPVSLARIVTGPVFVAANR